MTYIIAEIGSVHDGSIGNALKLIDVVRACGADCAKFQVHLAEFETRIDAPNPGYFSNESRYDYFKRTAFTKSEWIHLKKYCKTTGLDFMASVFSNEAVDLLYDIGCRNFKIPSGEVSNIPLFEHLISFANTEKIKVYLSSGMSSMAEVDQAMKLLDHNNIEMCVFQCSSIYPCPDDKVGLNVITQMKELYDCQIGFSDHTETLSASLGAITLGAEVIEKHITFSRNMYGSDAPLAMEPKEFNRFCKEIRALSQMLSSPIDKNNIREYTNMREIFSKSICAKKEMKIGTKLTANDLIYLKPGTGIPAANYKSIIGKKLTKSIKAQEFITQEHLK